MSAVVYLSITYILHDFRHERHNFILFRLDHWVLFFKTQIIFKNHHIARFFAKMSYLHQNHLKYKRLFNHQGYYVYWTMLPVSLDCPFLIAPSVFSNGYFKLFELFYYLYDKYIENGIKQLILRYSPLQHCILSYFRSNI